MITLHRAEIEDLIVQVENTLIHVNVYGGENSNFSKDLTAYKLGHIRDTLKRILKDDK